MAVLLGHGFHITTALRKAVRPRVIETGPAIGGPWLVVHSDKELTAF
jgi:hypothetical protein